MNIPELREILDGCPEAECKNPDLVGWTGENGFICAHCAARLLARGCGDRKILAIPNWEKMGQVCVLCGTEAK